MTGDGSAAWDEAEWGGPSFPLHLPRHDPGEPGPPGDPAVSRVVYALRDLRVEGPATAAEVLTAANVAAWLTAAQIAVVMAAFPQQRRVDWPVPDDDPGLRPVGPAYEPPGRRGEQP